MSHGDVESNFTRTRSAHEVSSAVNIYAGIGANALSAVAAKARPLVYVPNSLSASVSVIDPATYKVVRTFRTGAIPQHVVPAYDLKRLWVLNNKAGTVVPIDPVTGDGGKAVRVDDPYNMYFTPDGRLAIVVAEKRQRLDFLDPSTMQRLESARVDCKGIDHLEFTTDGRSFIATCEFSGKLMKFDLTERKVVGYLELESTTRWRRAMPQDIRSSPDGSVFGGGSPDMGNVSADGSELWVSGRYDDEVYVFDTAAGKLTHRIPVGRQPHGLCIWPQPGHYSLGHTGNMR